MADASVKPETNAMTDKPPPFLASKAVPIVMPIAFPAVGVLFATGADKVGLEGGLKGVYTGILGSVPKDNLALPMGVATLFFLLQQWKAMKVGQARIQYGVEWPFQMLGRGEKNAVEYNCVHRAHMHDFEMLPSFLFFLFVAATERPFSAGAAGLLFTIARLVGSIGYMSGAGARQKGAFGYLGLLLLQGITVKSILGRLV